MTTVIRMTRPLQKNAIHGRDPRDVTIVTCTIHAPFAAPNTAAYAGGDASGESANVGVDRNTWRSSSVMSTGTSANSGVVR